ncbi:MAG TPA: hypothetical protein VFA34_05505 [Actinomycetota bacterium]|jgi:hypothetical protein|nr:hypothetical protein [Actinomycetota bacterium]
MLRSLWRSIPPLSRLGLSLTGYGVLADFIHHVFTPNLHAGKVLHIGFIGHALTLAGMVLALLGVISALVESRRRAKQKGEGNAARSSTAASR